MIFTKLQASDEIKRLVDSFGNEIGELKTGNHVKEAQVEDKYIKPLFAALNWNVSGIGQTTRRQEFVVQGTIRSKKGTFVEPDYILRLPDNKGNMRDRLYVEAKLPKYNLIAMDNQEVIKYVRQAYRYAHMKTAQTEDVRNWVRLSVLTDFEEFLLFDCVDSTPLEPGKEHLLKKAIVEPFPWTFDRYVTDFDFLWETFERNNVVNGSLGNLKVTPADKIKKRTAPDEKFLQDIDRWRKELGTSMWRLNRENESFNDDLLAAATQLIIDRLIFIKMLSDKGIEPDYLTRMIEKLSGIRDSNVSLFQACKSLFSSLNSLYNGTIFSDRAELDVMPVENKVLVKILKELDPEYAPYTLSSMDVRIIGNAYERYLGNVIHADGRGVSVEPKPEVRKAKGVYYTPGYIVEYIVEHTVGELLKKCDSPEDVSNLKIVDPACGSGSFLLGAYDIILKWYQDYFEENGRISKKYRDLAELINLPDGRTGIRLTAKLKRSVLLNNLYGVDIDPQAVEVAQFSLCMKALEGVEDRQELEAERTLFKQTILPDMSENIKCGNSLIGPDIYNDDLFDLIKPEDKRKINAFDWNRKDKLTERVNIGHIINKGGFDAVIGNPPWGSELTKNLLLHIRQKFVTAQGELDSFVLFIEKSLSLIKNNGLYGVIIPDTWLTLKNSNQLRRWMLESFSIEEIIALNESVFESATVDPLVLIIRKQRPTENHLVSIRNSPKKTKLFDLNALDIGHDYRQLNWLDEGASQIKIHITANVDSILCRMRTAGVPLETLTDYKAGCKPYEVGKGTPPQSKPTLDQKPFTSFKQIESDWKKLIRGNDVQRYLIRVKKAEWVKYGKWLAAPRDPDIFKGPRILIQAIRNPSLKNRIIANFTKDEMIARVNVYTLLKRNNVDVHYLYILGVLNSNLMNWFLKKDYGLHTYIITGILQLPIRRINFAEVAEKAQHDKLIKLVQSMIDMNKELQTTVQQNEKERISSEIAYTDRQIDKLVYELYDITEEEIAVIDGR